MDFIIRDASKDDFAAVYDFEVQVFAQHVQGQPESFQAGDPLSYEDYMSWFEGDSIILIAEFEGIAIGIASARLPKKFNSHPNVRTHKLYHLATLFVVAQHRKQGIGQALYTELRRRVIQAGFEGLSFNVWAFNKEAQHFYESLGAKCVSQRYEDYDG
jgi:ribosomal protein S18 acetylase RimI-like enzyme